MLDAALAFLAKELNGYLLARTAETFGEALVARPVDENGKWAIGEDHIGITLVNVEEERILKSQLPEAVYVGGRQVVLEPQLRLTLQVLFAAQFKQYNQALRYLSLVLTFFQAHPRFARDEYPALDPGIEQLVPELQSLSYEQLNQLWAFVGGKQLPSVVYRVRMVLLQDLEPFSVGPPITRINASLSGR
jgi:hypothetical protein